MELKRDIYKDLLQWKQKNKGKVLELKGARQIGKTYILDKFGRENYATYIYINMALSGPGWEVGTGKTQAGSARPSGPAAL